jgi:ribonuclease HII
MRLVGIDEAGYGPTLGPLSVVLAACDGDADAALRALGVADSKRVHDTGDLGALERIALPGARWLTGRALTTAGELFACLGEASADRAAVPWMAAAEALALPVRDGGAAWMLPAAPERLDGRLLHPRHLNAARRAGINRAAAELDAVRALLGALDPALAASVTCDRLGGRKFYGDLLQRAWPGRAIDTIEETPAACRYRCGAITVSFVVGGESASALTALASCIAKYARELHMLLLNRYFAGLKPTAGYPQDAKRWLAELPADALARWRGELVRS